MSTKNTSISFGYYKTELKKIIRCLKRDLKDDWVTDPLHFNDILDSNLIVSYIDSNIEENLGQFEPIERELINIPKKDSGLRYSLETCIYDRIAYHTFGIKLIEYFDPLISNRIFSHRLDNCSSFKRKGKERYLFLNAIEQWRKFEEYVRVDSNDKFILKTDIQNYFENIRIEDLKATLYFCLKNIHVNGSEKANIRFCIDSICRCLKKWSFNGLNGLPQNRDISSFLANIYMMPVDKFLSENEMDFYRYMDDIKIICRSKYDARRCLKSLIVKLREIGLNINQSKTAIMEPGEDVHIAFHRRKLVLEKIDSMLTSKKLPLVAFALLEIKRRLESLIKQNDFERREFRFCIRRLCKIALCKEISLPENFFSDITKGIVNNISDIPEPMDQFYSYLISVDLTNESLVTLEELIYNQKISIYGWQNYFIWKLFIMKEYRTPNLIRFAIDLIKINNNTANIAGAILYIGKFGTVNEKTIILKSFNKFNNFFLQRHAMIALQEVEYNIIAPIINDKVSKETKGFYRNLHESKSHKYIIPPEPVKLAEIFREVSFYG
jgi:hypothetical protein